MCWNADISINTFLFSCFVLLFIYFTNTYTKYKTPFFDNPIVYLFILSVVSMQLIEFFLWRNLKNKSVNDTLSKLASFLFILQPLFLMLLIPILKIRNTMLTLYLLFMAFYLSYKKIFSPIMFHTSIAKNGHLSWEFVNNKGYENIFTFIYLLFYISTAFLVNNFLITLFLIPSFILSLFFYFRDGTFGTMWCWISNLFLLYFLVDILIVKPYYEYNGLC
jgi:hypothetical protein